MIGGIADATIIPIRGLLSGRTTGHTALYMALYM